MRILVLSFYYPPDLAAGSFRASAFVSALRRNLSESDQIDIFTTVPNRYHSFQKTAPTTENHKNVSVRRIPVPKHKSGMLGQAAAFLSFAWGVRRLARDEYDIIWATSSRLFTAFLGALLSRRMNVPLYLDMRDIFTEVIEEIIKKPILKPLWVTLRSIERITVTRARGISVVSQAFEEHFRSLVADTSITVLPNGIDEEFLQASYDKRTSSETLTILYAGNIGEGQGLHRIIPPCASRLGSSIQFLVVGDGGAKSKLQAEISAAGLDNVKISAPVDRDKLIELYAQSDYLFLHLNNHKAFRKVLPSKVFEYAATGKPIIAGVEGYAKSFIEANIENAAAFPPCDVEGFITVMKRLRQGNVPRNEFVQKFGRTCLMNRMVAEVLKCIQVSARKI